MTSVNISTGRLQISELHSKQSNIISYHLMHEYLVARNLEVQKVGEEVQLICKNAYVNNGRPLYAKINLRGILTETRESAICI